MPSASPSPRAIVRAHAPPSGSRSAFVSTNAAGTPPAAASETIRSQRRSLGSGNGSTTSTSSTFAASTWLVTGAPAARRTTVPRRSSTAAMTPSASNATQSPVVGVRSLAARSRPRAATSRGGASLAVADEPAAAVLREHASGGERGIAELGQLGGEIRTPPDGGGCSMQGEILHEFVGGTGAASVPGRYPGRVIRRPRRD